MRHFSSYEESYFWATHGGAEIDLLLVRGGKKVGFDIKYTDSPKITKSMQIALEDLKLEHLCVIIPSSESKFKLAENVTCISISYIEELINT